MAFSRPTLTEIEARVQGDFRSELQITAIIRRSFLSAISKAIAGAAHLLHGHLKEISKQAFPDQATGVFLKRWGSIYGVPAKAATYTQLTISGSGTNGSNIPLGTIFKIDSGETYTTDAAVTISGGVYSVQITAVNAGSQTNLSNGNTVKLQSPISGVNTSATVSATVTEGEDAETEASQQSRIVQRIQEPPAGGKVSDYIAWATSVAAVTRAFVFPTNRGPGTVDVSFVLDNNSPIIPIPAKVAEVQAYINTQKPVAADVIVFAPISYAVNFSIALKPNSAAVQAAVTSELKDLFTREANVANAIDPDNVATNGRLDGKILLSRINEAISIATGETDHRVLSPVTDIQPSSGAIALLGTITFTTLA
jgi:uncharacterized phage protein gp47/JayE